MTTRILLRDSFYSYYFYLSLLIWTHYAVIGLITTAIILVYIKARGIKLSRSAEKILGHLLSWVHVIAPLPLGLILYPYVAPLIGYTAARIILALIATIMLLLALLPKRALIRCSLAVIALSVVLAMIAVVTAYVSVAKLLSTPLASGIGKLSLMLSEGAAGNVFELCLLDSAALVGFDVAVFRAVLSMKK